MIENLTESLVDEGLNLENRMSSNFSLYFGLIGASVITYFVIPFIFRFSKIVQRHMIFMHLFSFSRHRRNFYDPSVHEIIGGRNFYIDSSSKDSVRIGLWHILPRSLAANSKGKSDDYWEDALRNSGKPIFLYFHGNSGTRATSHRIELYKLLQQRNCHVIAFDYRGFADSSSILPSETGVVSDSLLVYNWLRKILGPQPSAPIFFWGHSLGTGISTHLVSKLSLENGKSINPLAGLILEAPFTNMKDEVKSIHFTMIYKFWPCFDWCFGSALENNDVSFESDVHIKNIDIPILILHVINDSVVPYRLGRRLHETASKHRSSKAKPVQFKKFSGFNFIDAHCYICRVPNLPAMITEFMKSCVKNEWPAASA